MLYSCCSVYVTDGGVSRNIENLNNVEREGDSFFPVYGNGQSAWTYYPQGKENDLLFTHRVIQYMIKKINEDILALEKIGSELALAASKLELEEG